MKTHHLFLTLALAVTSGCGLTPEEQAVADEILACEPQQRWKQILWASSVDAALARARSEKKPILFFFAVNEGGNKNAEKT